MAGTYAPLKDEEGSPFFDRSTPQELQEQKTEKWLPSRWWIIGVAIVLAVTAASFTGFIKHRPKYQGFIPEFNHRIVTFANDSRYVPDDVFSNFRTTQHTLKSWVELSAAGRGFLHIPNPESYNNLAPPYLLDPLETGEKKEVYMVSMYHQLHCLSQIMEAYATIRQGGDMTEKDWHMTHCFDYLRQSIMCSADTTLEGSTEYGDGWGAQHMCKDYDDILEWMNARVVWEWPVDGHI